MLALLSNPYALIAVGVGLLASYGAVGYKAYQAGQDRCIAAHAELIDVEIRTRDAAMAAAGEAISSLKVEHQTIRQKTEVITREVPVYRDCQHTDDTFRLLNDALTPPARRGEEGAD